GNLSSLEPHAIASGAKPGRYQLQVRLENAVNAIWATDEYFNVTDRYGFINDSISSSDSKINAIAGEGKSKKSPHMGILASILALTGAALFRRRG
ncbi:MAG: hypothetical protein LUQ08_03055, partial [Methanothrix sp.]|nr:hypothetical protein [Methanothrix sp.]